MDNLRNVIKILFCYVSANEIICDKFNYNKINEKSVLLLANQYMNQYSNNEIKNMLSYLGGEFKWQRIKERGIKELESDREPNVFDALQLFGNSVLEEKAGMPICNFEQLLRWRDMVISLEEDLFITAYLAQRDMLNGRYRTKFFWPPVIGHDEKRINNMLSKGVVENHFHMKGSAPLFHLSWINLMNHVRNSSFIKKFEEYEQRRLKPRVNYNEEVQLNSLLIEYYQGALIRFYLFQMLRNKEYEIEEVLVDSKFLLSEIHWENIRENIPLEMNQYERKIEMLFGDLKVKDGNYEDCVVEGNLKQTLYNVLRNGCVVPIRNLRGIIDDSIIKKVIEVENYKNLRYLLRSPEALKEYMVELQKKIQEEQQVHPYAKYDYAIFNDELAYNEGNHINELYSGERWIMYTMFRYISSDNSGKDKYIDLFYAYLLIKENIRSELIQSNSNTGFDNFLLYQNRKEEFIENTILEPMYIKMSVRDTILNQHIDKLEARITPKVDWLSACNKIKEYDEYICGSDKDLINKYFYVYHFVKDKDYLLESDTEEYRHWSKRDEIKKQAYAIMQMRESKRKEGQRVLGIDACSPEIGCRPEVFAQVFRCLKNHNASYQDTFSNCTVNRPQLHATYHAGEDFLDVIDGLRAIDEAINFLNLANGDRLGHALALGIDIKAWYEAKAFYLLIPQMDYLDNLVWLYAQIDKYHISGCEDTIRFIEKKFDEYFRTIYLNHMNEKKFHKIQEEAEEYYRNKGGNGYRCPIFYFSINTYYESMQLRGDNPQLYEDGFFKPLSIEYDFLDKFAENKKYPSDYSIRFKPEVTYLYYLYHYNCKIKKAGAICREIKVDLCLIKALEKVQLEMQREVNNKGIAIEANPSSNVLISNFKRYEHHPILRWNNRGLNEKAFLGDSCPQLSVSINTDDQGVFATYIEQEYAYMAVALRKMRDSSGNAIFNMDEICEWLNNIRLMGYAQCFEQ